MNWIRLPLSSGVTLAIILLLFLAFNLVWIQKTPNVRLDLTKQKFHTLSPSTKTLLVGIQNPIDLYFFNSNKHPQKNHRLKSYGQRVEILLKEYEKASKGKINLHLINPMRFSDEEYKARLFGLSDKQGFFGLIGTSKDASPQSIESFDPDQEALLEYEISHLIHKVTNPEQPLIGLIAGLPAKDKQDEKNQISTSSWPLLEEVRRQFSLVNLGENVDHIPEHIKTLIVAHPGQLSDQTLYAIDQFVLAKGTLMVFVDPLSEPGFGTIAPPPTSNLHILLTAWGVEMPKGKVLADNLYATPLILTTGQATVRHPAALTLPRQAMARDDASNWKLQTVTVLSSGALIPLKNSRTTFTPLLQSSPQAALFDAGRFVTPTAFDSLLSEASASNQRHVIAARIQGEADSVFPEGIIGQQGGLQNATGIHVVVVADTDLLSDRIELSTQNSKEQGTPTSGNAAFVLNTLEHLSGPDTLLGIRPRSSSLRPLEVLQMMRDQAEKAYLTKASVLEQRLLQTEREWQSLNSGVSFLGTKAVRSEPLLQALNKERLRLPKELDTLKSQAYSKVRSLERNVQLLNTVVLPLLLSLVALGIFLHRRRQYSLSRSQF